MSTADGAFLPEPHPMELAAARAASAGDLGQAQRLLETLAKEQPQSLHVHINLAAVRRRAGDFNGALASVDRALALAPRDFAALLMRATLLERRGQERQAALAYGVALAQAPNLDTLNPAARKATLHAQAVYDGHKRELAAALDNACKAAGGQDVGQGWRLQAFVDTLAGRTRRYRQEPTGFFYPGLPAVPFLPRAEFGWLTRLEAATETIAAELQAVLQDASGGFTPYVDYQDSLPLDQWRALNRSPDWSAYHLLFNGEPVPGNSERCPRTLEVLSGLPQPRLPGRSPAAMFSVLKPHTRIPPHTGVSNTRLVVHLPLIVPPGCLFRVGGETRAWERGRAWVFDDTIEHEAVNDSDQDRIILIFDIEQPAISPGEHTAIADIARTLDRFGGAPVFGPL